jgi:YVTN family beta-propeller protein
MVMPLLCIDPATFPALAPDERLVFVSNRDSDSISVIDALTCTRVTEINQVIGSGQIGALSLGTKGSRLYALSMSSSTLAVFAVSGAPAAIRRLAPVTLPGPMYGIVASPAAIQ